MLLASHIDTIPGQLPTKTEEEWIEGRGAVDAKGPLVSMMAAAAMAWAEGKKVAVAALSDEENKSAGAKELIELGGSYSHIIVGEPTNTNGVAIEYRGLLHIDINCAAPAEHASSATFNLIAKTCERILKVYSFPRSFEGPVITPTIIRGGEYMNVSPTRVLVHFDVRFSKEVSQEKVMSILGETFEDCEVKVVESVPPVAVSPNSEAVKTVMRGLLTQGIRPKLIKKAGTSDMNLLVQLTKSIATYGPGDPHMEHSGLERVNLEELYIATNTYKYAVDNLCRE
ncbi:acetyl-lysine deacetylase [Sulfodiicoccus acidiphilus]|uniref:Acetyl-lysine deacetylase n=1 Tax=Sulfodiicoccus acidiphilus TaxID=1670455 RepID=A0A830H4Y5_9CREN|nr:acetyl-lysine deacetylase [Sulfodiicoccus acidiphilus]